MLRYLLILVFITALGIFWLLYLIIFQRKSQVKYRLQEHTGYKQNEQITEVQKPVKETLMIRFKDAYINTKSYRKQQKLIAQAYIKVKPEELALSSMLGGVVLALLLWLFQKNLMTAIAGFLLGMVLPIFVLRIMGQKRAKQMNKQLPQALSILSNGLRAGFSFPQAMGVVTKEMEAPIAEEFGKVLQDSQLGKPMDEALADFNKRTDDEDLSIFISTLLTQMQVGGDLAEVLDIIAQTIRERMELHGQIRTLTSQSKFSAIVIGVLPIAIGVALFFMNPEYIGVLFTDPLGLVMVAAAAVMMVLGFIALYKIVNIKV